MNRLPRTFIGALLLACTLATSSPLAGASAFGWLGGLFDRDPVERLLSSRTRPTMRQLVNALEKKGQTEPLYPRYLSMDHGSWSRMEEIDRTMPRAIALLERSFPGAIWAPLGRDAVIFGDALDAFYISIGQPGRVSRLNASGKSIRGAKPKELLRFLQSAGLNFDIERGRPLVGLDRTSYSPSSQSTHLIRTGYEAYAKAGGNAVDLIQHFNFVGLTSYEVHGTLKDGSIEDYFATANIEANPTPVLSEVMQLYVGGWTDSEAWHDPFGTLGKQIDGSFEGSPGKRATLDLRRAILGHMQQIYLAVSKPGFLEKVQEEAKKLGYEFPRGDSDFLRLREQMSERIRLRAKNFPLNAIASFKTLTSQMRPLEGPVTKGSDTNASQEIENWYTSQIRSLASLSNRFSESSTIYQRSHLALYLLGEATKLNDLNIISSYGYRRLVIVALSTMDTNPEILHRFRMLYEASASLREALKAENSLFNSMQPYFVVPSALGNPQLFDGAKAYRSVMEALNKPNNCKDVFSTESEGSAA